MFILCIKVKSEILCYNGVLEASTEYTGLHIRFPKQRTQQLPQDACLTRPEGFLHLLCERHWEQSQPGCRPSWELSWRHGEVWVPRPAQMQCIAFTISFPVFWQSSKPFSSPAPQLSPDIPCHKQSCVYSWSQKFLTCHHLNNRSNAHSTSVEERGTPICVDLCSPSYQLQQITAPLWASDFRSVIWNQ